MTTTKKHALTVPENDLQISMSNAVARSAQGLSLFEKRTVALAMGKTDSMSAQVLHKASIQGWSVKLLAMDYAESWQVSPTSAYEQLKEATENLMHRQAAFKTETRRGQKITRVNWCGQSVYHEGEGWVEISFTPQIAPHLLGLRTKFTSYKLAQAGALRSLYAWRMLELFTSWQDKGKWTVDVEDFADAVEAPESCRKDFGNLRKRVIEPAIKELREKDNWLIEWEPVKAGRRVSGLSFKFKRNPQGGLFDQVETQVPTKEERFEPESYDTTATAEDTAVDMARKEGLLGQNVSIPVGNEVGRIPAGEAAEAFKLLLETVPAETLEKFINQLIQNKGA